MAKEQAAPAAPDLFRDHEDTVTARFAGRDRKWLLCRKALRLAKAAGYPLAQIMERLNAIQTGAPETDDVLAAYGDLVWIGVLPFEPDADREEITDLMTVPDIHRANRLLVGPLLAAVEEGKAMGPQGSP